MNEVRTTGENCGTLRSGVPINNRRRMRQRQRQDREERTVVSSPTSTQGRNHAHMSAQVDFEVRKPALGVHVPERADTVDDEAVVRNGRLEALQAVPCTK